MHRIINYIAATSLGLTLLFIIEWITLGGKAIINFEKYTLIGWVFQIMLISFTIAISIEIIDSFNNDQYDKNNN